MKLPQYEINANTHNKIKSIYLHALGKREWDLEIFVAYSSLNFLLQDIEDGLIHIPFGISQQAKRDRKISCDLILIPIILFTEDFPTSQAVEAKLEEQKSRKSTSSAALKTQAKNSAP